MILNCSKCGEPQERISKPTRGSTTCFNCKTIRRRAYQLHRNREIAKKKK